jgi:hypothetical protein
MSGDTRHEVHTSCIDCGQDVVEYGPPKPVGGFRVRCYRCIADGFRQVRVGLRRGR